MFNVAMNTPTESLTRPDGTPIRVLVVDDEQMLADLLASALRYEGWQVNTAVLSSTSTDSLMRKKPADCSKALAPSRFTFKSSLRFLNFPSVSRYSTIFFATAELIPDT